MALSRRSFRKKAIFTLLGVVALVSAAAGGIFLAPVSSNEGIDGFGPIIKDRNQILDLPKGFSYKIIARAGDRMTDGFYVPGLADGMAAFPGPDGSTILICNHEFRIGYPESVGPFKGKGKLSEKLGEDMIYDRGNKGNPCLGSTTTLVYDAKARKLKSHFLNMVGTLANCSGGITPYNTWLSCEEVFENPGENCAQKHGYVFEGPIFTEPRVIKPVPLKGLGRYQHEGVAVVPQTGLVYLTEDQIDGLLYRFVPDKPGHLAEGGRLQCLAVVDKPQFDTRDWKGPALLPGEVLPVYWIDLDSVDPETDNLRQRGYKLGAALFAGAEGICLHEGTVIFDCTNGSRTGKGQVWRYTPSPLEGTPREKESPDGSTMFLNILEPGLTLAVTGPWKKQ